MKKQRHRNGVAPVVSMIVGLMGAGDLSAVTTARRASAADAPAATTAAVRYEIKLEGEARETARGVGVALKAQFHNDSDTDVTIPLWGQAQFGDVFRFEILGPDKKPLAAPMPERFSQPIPVLLVSGGKIATPFVVVKAKGMVECNIALGAGTTWPNTTWFFTHPGEYTLTGEFVNTHDSYVEPQTYAIVKAATPFVGSVKSKPVQFTVTHHGAEWGVLMPAAAVAGQISRGEMVPIGGDPSGLGGLALSAVIVDDKGQPLPDAVVEISADKDTGVRAGSGGGMSGIVHKAIDRQRSSADGRVSFDELPPGVDGFTLTAVHEGNYQRATATVTRDEAAKKHETRITLKPGLVISGNVVNPERNALPGVRVNLNAGGYIYTGVDGKFRLEGLSSFRAGFVAPGFKNTAALKPDPGHENDGTWMVVLEPQTPATPGARGLP